jgi:hypothetical protein
LGKKRVRRTWSDDEKQMICDQARLPGVSTAQVARRYAMNANLLFKWLRDPAYQADITGEDQSVFDLAMKFPVKMPENIWESGYGALVESGGVFRWRRELALDGE